VIPKTLAVNAACDATELVAKLRAEHNFSQMDPAKHAAKAHSGLNLATGSIQNCIEAGVIEPAMSKAKSIAFATEAAITILRIDDRITIQAKEEQHPGR